MKSFLLILMACLFIGCVPQGSSIAVNFNKSNNSTSPAQNLAINVSSVQIINNQLIISGNGLSEVTDVKVDGAAFNELFSIESKSGTQIIANSVRAFSFDVSKVFNVILSDANASATFPIDFNLCNATLNGKGFDCAAPIADKDVLSYDSVSGKWKPRAVSGLNYLGTFNASSNPATGPATQPAGSYYIVSHSGTVATIPFTMGDWIVSNGSAWQKIDNSTAVLSVFGRNGAVVAETGDYNLSMLGDISFPTAPVAGKVLKFDGTHWVAGDDNTGGGGGGGPVDASTISSGAVSNAEFDWLDGVTSSIQAQLNAKEGSLPTGGTASQYFAGNKTLQTLNTMAVPESGTNYYFTDAKARAATLTGLSAGTGTIVAGDTILGAFGKLASTQGDYVSKSANTTVLGQITIDATMGVLNVPAPASATQATNKAWVENLVDSYGHWAKSGSNISFSGGKVGIGTASPAYPLSVNGIIESTTGGVRFPDGTTQLTAAQWNSGGGSTLGTALTPTTFAPQGQLGTQSTTPVNGSIDDGYYPLTLPFPVNFNGTMYSTIYIGTNSYATFASGSTVYSGLNGANPNVNKIVIDAADRSSNSVWFNSTPTAFSIRYEGGCTTSPSASLVWELSASTANDKKLILNIVSVCSSGFSTIASPTTVLQSFTPTANSAYEIEYKSLSTSSSLNYLAGNVGIGMDTPTAKLEVAGQVKITGGSPGAGKILTSDSSGLATWETPGVAAGDNLGNHTATTNIRLGSNYISNDGSSSGIAVHSNGNVGIGDVPAEGRLTVSGNAWGNYSTSAIDSFYPFNNMSQGSGFLEIVNTGGGFSSPGAYLGLKTTSMNATPYQRAYIGIKANMGAANYTPDIIIGQQTGATSYQERMRIAANGNVGIGVTNPSEKLVVDNGTTVGTYAATGWMHSSDRRLKHDISPLEDSLEKILKLTGVEYIFNTDPENKKQIGFIAQDVEPIFPEVVGTDKKGFKSMVYSNLIAPLVESVKTLYARIVGVEKHNLAQDRQIASKSDKAEVAVLKAEAAALKAENAKLKQENIATKARLDKIEKALNLK